MIAIKSSLSNKKLIKSEFTAYFSSVFPKTGGFLASYKLVILFTRFLRPKIQVFFQSSVIRYINKTGGSNRAINKKTKLTFSHYRQIRTGPTAPTGAGNAKSQTVIKKSKPI
jgi:hypothetical protein